MSECYALRVLEDRDGHPLDAPAYIMEEAQYSPDSPFTEHLPRAQLCVEKLFAESVAEQWSERLGRKVRAVRIVDVGEVI